ncbi:hypothetical protein DFH06DRAFT_1147894 [Mycena polygramma]|nr:hypothetical protein DFH06DRAFT_1147894 [Mycena polygramma]
MNSSCILPACLPVQEMWDAIIDQLHSTKDIQSCSLTCRSLVARAQSRIFRSISIYTKGPKTAETVASELVSIIDESEHLLAQIRRLSLGDCKLAVVAHLRQLPWSRLEDLTLTYREYSGLIDDTDLDEIYHLVSLPCLLQLTLKGDWKTEAMYKIFIHCTPRLERVRFIDCCHSISPLHLPASDVSAPKPKIRHLISIDSEIFGVLAADPSFPLDFSTLTHIRCSGSASSTALAVFAFRHRTTIESLDLGTMDAGIESLNLGLFPVLKHVSCAFIGVELNHILKSLGPDNTVDTIRAGLDGPNYVRDLADFQRTINALKMPALRRVELQVLFPAAISPESKVSRERAFESVVERELPEIKERGQLFLHFV